MLSIFLLPLFAFIPGAACAGALLYVGVLMMGNVTNIDFKNIKSAVPAFLTIIVMLLAYSITKGIGIGVISHVLISSISYVVEIIIYTIKNKKRKNNDASENTEEELVKPKWDCSVVAIVVCALFLVYFLVPTVL
jgi:xanthine/uracil/vitamin C permease (AzgA family)